MMDEFTKLLLLVAAQGALGMAAVAGLRATLTLTAKQSMAAAFFIAIITCVAWDMYAATIGQASPWQVLPIKIIVVGLISMGWWSGSKTTTGNS